MRKKNNLSNLTNRKQDEYEMYIIHYDNKEHNVNNRYCCKNLYYYIDWLFEKFSRKNLTQKNLNFISFLEALPSDIIKEISTHLDPLSIVKLSHTSKSIREVLNDDFFVNYNFIHEYKSFNEENSYLFILSSTNPASPIKIMIANYFYQIGIKENRKQLIQKSSFLGFPKAQNYLKKENNKTSSTASDSRASYYYGGGYDRASGAYYCSECGVPIRYCRHGM